MNTNMTGFRWFSKVIASYVLWTKVASALKGLKHGTLVEFNSYVPNNVLEECHLEFSLENKLSIILQNILTH